MLEEFRLWVSAPARDSSYLESLLHGDALFPSLTPEWVAKLPPVILPGEKAPDREKIWGHHAKLELETDGRRKPLDLLHLGLAGDLVWPFFLQLHSIRVARVIADPPL
ncbi:MAG TPA: hypothetical protein VG146_15385 [Verrucomicrobiae bacterium]|nr:hypothetical protein [Verrucomicrobiae bacterium]